MTHTISMPADAAKQALAHILKGHGPRHTLPSLGQVEVQSCEGMAALTTTNLDRQVTAFVPDATYDEDGMIVYVPIPQLQAALDMKISQLRDSTLSVQFGDDQPTTVQVGKRIIEKQNDLEAPPMWEQEDTFMLVQVDDERYRKVIAAAAPDDSRPVLAGIHVTSKAVDAGIIMEAADGFRMGVIVTGEASVHTADFIIPSSAFSGIPKGQPFSIHCQNSGKDERAWLSYQLNDKVFVVYGTRLIDGTFPDLRQIIPSHSPGDTITLKADDIDAIATYATKYGQHSVVNIERTELVAVSSEHGTMKINGYDHVHNLPDKLALNGEYMKWAVEGDDELELNFGTAAQAVVSYQGPLTLVVMPMVIGAN